MYRSIKSRVIVFYYPILIVRSMEFFSRCYLVRLLFRYTWFMFNIFQTWFILLVMQIKLDDSENWFYQNTGLSHVLKTFIWTWRTSPTDIWKRFLIKKLSSIALKLFHFYVWINSRWIMFCEIYKKYWNKKQEKLFQSESSFFNSHLYSKSSLIFLIYISEFNIWVIKSINIENCYIWN